MLAVYHVALTGADVNNGSAATPFRTVQAAIDAAAAIDDGADEVRVAAGNYNALDVDLSINVPDDAELDSLDILGSFNGSFTARDFVNTPTQYALRDAGGQVTIADDETLLDGFAFTFDGTADGIVVSADQVTVRQVSIKNALDGLKATNVDSLTLEGVESVLNLGDGFEISGVDQLAMSDLTINQNYFGRGGAIADVGMLTYVPRTSQRFDFVRLVDSRIERPNFASEQPLEFSNLGSLIIDTRDQSDSVVIVGPTNVPGGVHVRSDGDFHDSLGISTNSGHPDFIRIAGDTVAVYLGPDPQSATPDVVTFEGIRKLTLESGGGADTIVIDEMAGADPLREVQVNGQDENDAFEVNLASTSTNAQYQFNGGNGRDGLTVFTRSANDNAIKLIEGLEIKLRTAANDSVIKAVGYNDVSGVSVFAGDGNDTLTVAPAFGGIGLWLDSFAFYGEAGNDFGSIGTWYPAYSGAEMLFDAGEGSDNQLWVDPGTNFGNGGDTFVVDSLSVRARLAESYNPWRLLQYRHVQTLDLRTQDGTDLIFLEQAAGAPNLPSLVRLHSQAAGNHQYSKKGDGIFIRAENIPSTVTIDVDTDADGDRISVYLPAGPVQPAINIFGQNSTWLEDVRIYADPNSPADITVGDLNSNARIRLDRIDMLLMLGGSYNDRLINATDAHSVLDGLGGDDTLTGGRARNVLVGGAGSDRLQGDQEQDLVISGAISFDEHVFALLSILDEWHYERPILDRKIALTSGVGMQDVLNYGKYLIPAQTVLDDDVIDWVSGDSAPDWLLARLGQDQVNSSSEDIATDI